jgi:hypothetical protein
VPVWEREEHSTWADLQILDFDRVESGLIKVICPNFDSGHALKTPLRAQRQLPPLSHPPGAAMADPADHRAGQDDPVSVAKACYRAYVDKDRSAIERLIAEDFHFTSPLDNRIDRNTYFERCWPNSESTADFTFVHLVQQGERVFVTYEGRNAGGNSFRNTEILTVRKGKLVDAEVYFGWSLPHPAAAGGFTAAGEQP